MTDIKIYRISNTATKNILITKMWLASRWTVISFSLYSMELPKNGHKNLV